jgi:hypothetical protein
MLGKELSGVEERLAWAVTAGAKDAGTIRLLEDELEAGRATCLAVKAELGCSLAIESERNVQLQASLSSVRQEFLNARKPVKRRRSSCLSLKARPATARNDAMRCKRACVMLGENCAGL